MSTHKAEINWVRNGDDFSYEKFSRSHSITIKNQNIQTTGSTDFPGNANGANPEEMLISALMSCHMMTFLAIASKKRLTVDLYKDTGTAFLEKNSDGRFAVTRAELHPQAQFSGSKHPTPEEIDSMHEKAHKYCVIANSINAEVQIKPQ